MIGQSRRKKASVAPRKLAFGVVRDKTGKPRVDGDPNDLPPEIQCMLTEPERESLGLWPKQLARDAQGVKRLKKLGDGKYEAVDPLVAASAVYDDGLAYPVSPRRDVPAGEILNLGAK
jgi:hypothetical protein